MMKFEKILLLLVLLFLPACSAASPTAAPVGEPPPTAAVSQLSDGYPTGDPNAVEPPTQAYPGPPSPTDDPMAAYPKTLQVPQPKPGLGVITGRILEIGNDDIFLAPTLILGTLSYPNELNAGPPLVGFSETDDPKGIQDQAGKFVFEDIQPGSYAIVIWTPAASTLLTDKAGNTAVIEVTADKVVDLGDVYVP